MSPQKRPFFQHAFLLAPLFLMAACGEKAAPSKMKIFNGQIVAKDALPSTVKVVSKNGYCSGTFIAKDRVLTAAHCIKKGDIPSVIYKNTKIAVNRVIINPFFKHRDKPVIDGVTRSFDLAVLLTAKEVSDYRSLCAFKPQTGAHIRLVGFGRDGLKGERPSYVKRTGTTFLARVSHGRMSSHEEGLAASKKGDSGGSVLDAQKGCLMGVMSTGAEEGTYSGFVNLSSDASRAFIDFSLKVENRAKIRLRNRTPLPIYVQSENKLGETKVRAGHTALFFKDSNLRVRYASTCQLIFPQNKEEVYQVRLMAYRPRKSCAYGVGCLDVLGDLAKPARHFTGCDKGVSYKPFESFVIPKVSFSSIKQGGMFLEYSRGQHGAFSKEHGEDALYGISVTHIAEGSFFTIKSLSGSSLWFPFEEYEAGSSELFKVYHTESGVTLKSYSLRDYIGFDEDGLAKRSSYYEAATFKVYFHL